MNSEQIQELKAHIGNAIVFDDSETLRSRRFDRWCIKHYRDWRGQNVEAPACVVRPQCAEDVQKTVNFARDRQIAIIPFGLGSGVCGGVEADSSQLMLDMSDMNKMGDINEIDLLATFEAGTNGLVAEEAVAAKGLTIAHWPQSIGISSVGGWVSTRASGQFSTAYGNIEDIVYSVEVVLPNGDLVTLGKAPRAASGPDLRHLIMGAEGTLGIITKVTLSLRRQPEHRETSAYYAPSMEAGFVAQRQLVQSGWQPPVMRQYDASEVARNFPDYVHDDSALILLVHEGPRSRVVAETQATSELMQSLGLTPADHKVTEKWLENRNHVPEWTDLLKQGLIADTIEVSASWTKIDEVYENVVAALGTVPSIVNASAHSSHVYRSGINLYFTFACMPEDAADMESLYFECWDKALEATAAAGGGIAHHHGSGRLRKPYIHHDLGEGGIEIFKTVKKALDPDGLMNPGNLMPD